MRHRLRDVAELAQVSEATVSRVMNQRPGVSDATRAQVQRVLAELGIALPPPQRRPAAGLVGLIVPELDNPIFPAFAQTIESRLAACGYTAVLGCATLEGVDEREYLDMFTDRRVAGVVVVSGLHADTEADHSAYGRLLDAGVPMVFVNGYVSDLEAPFVSCDDRHAVHLAVSHLHHLGHRRIGFMTGPARYVVAQRKLEAFALATSQLFGAADDELVVDAVFSVEGGHAAARQLLERGVTGIVASSDLMALGAVRAARDQLLSVPDDVSVVGFDDTRLMSFTDPPLTTVRQPVRSMCQHVTSLLLEQMGGARPTNREYLFRPDLVVRGSTALARPSRRSGSGRHRSLAGQSHRNA